MTAGRLGNMRPVMRRFSDEKRSSDKWIIYMTTYLVGVFSAVGIFVVSNYGDVKRASVDVVELASRAIKSIRLSIMDFKSIHYVERPGLQAQIEKALSTGGKEEYGAYTIIYGAKGVGKSNAVRFMLKDRTGVVAVSVYEANTTVDIMRPLTFELLGEEGRSII